MEAICNVCSEEADIRFNFADMKDEIEYHKNYVCVICKIKNDDS